ncbi:MAG TPA: cytochrome c-type biogenesis protein [Burkholderiales bacterium]|nr:cytochrome c-type biogenesis protein [Burkholderiales bacterium]
MRRLTAAILFCWLLPLGAAAKEAVPMAEDPVVEQRLNHLAEELRCLVCQNESLVGSRAELANDLRREIRDLIKAGKSDREIVDYLVQRYGDFVRYRPPVKASTYLLWFGPYLLLALGGGGLVMYLRRRRSRVGVEERALSDDERERAESLLGGGERP